jgi:hypothetical protein
MFTRIENQIVFNGTPTNVEERKVLRDAGFVHVTGLRYHSLHSVEHKTYFIGEQLRSGELGRWCSNNGLTVIVTVGGEVWLKAGHASSDSQAISEFAPHGNGAFVPLSNGEQISHIDLMFRFDNPNYDILVPAS